MKHVLVTGANGGMGKATTLYLAKNGYHVYALDLSTPEEEQENITYIKCDVTNLESIESAKKIISQETDSLDALINMVGIYMLNSLIEMSEADFERIFKVNVTGTFLINKTFVNMLKPKSKIIIITSELAKRSSLPFTGIYGLTKKTLDEYAYSLKMELQLLDIYVSVLRPGAVKTGMIDVSTKHLDSFIQNTTHYNVSSKNFKKIVDKVEAKNIEPLLIAKKITKILDKKKPKFSYNINHNKLLKLLDILPRGWRFKIIKKILKPKEENK